MGNQYPNSRAMELRAVVSDGGEIQTDYAVAIAGLADSHNPIPEHGRGKAPKRDRGTKESIDGRCCRNYWKLYR